MNDADGKFVVVQGGQRVTGQLHEKQESAQAELEALKQKHPVTEGTQTGQTAPAPLAVKQNLYG